MATNQLVAEYIPLVHRIARKYLRALSPCGYLDYEDLIQDGSLALAISIEKYDPAFGIPIAAYCSFRIRGAIIDSIRKARSLRRQRDFDTWFSLEDLNGALLLVEPMTVEDQFEQDEMAREVRQAIAQLPEHYRQVIQMRYLEGKRMIDIAAALRAKEWRVTHLHRMGLCRLARLLNGTDGRRADAARMEHRNALCA